MNVPKQSRRLVWIVLACYCALGLSCAPTEPNIAATMRGEASLKVGQPVDIVFSLSNSSHAVLHILKWGTPYEGFKGAFYVVEKDGVKLEYKGRVVKRGEPTKDEYMTLSFGEVSRVTLDLTQAYDLSKPGKYTLKLATNIVDYAFDNEDLPRNRALHKTYTLTAPPHNFEITQ